MGCDELEEVSAEPSKRPLLQGENMEELLIFLSC